jgi:hypothetical protein
MKSDNWSSDAGAVGIALHGDDNEVAYNTISGSDTCSRFYGRDGSAVEVYGGQRNVVHHNRAINNNNFTELGNPRSSDTTYAYNIVTSTLKEGHFLTTRGGKSGYGPVYRTKAYNNSVYLTGSSAYAVQCNSGCGPSILSLRNNIIWSADKLGHADATFDEGDNIYWSPGGVTRLWYAIAASSLKVDPRWVNPSAGDFNLQSSSPAINAGSTHALNMGFTKDYDGAVVPQGGSVDIGAQERGSSALPPSPPSVTSLAADSFGRTSSSGWATADIGGSYSYVGSASALTVQSGTGRMFLSRNSSHGASLYGASARDVDIRIRLSMAALPAGHGQFVYIVGRRSTDGTEYRAKLRLRPNGKVFVGFSRTSGGKELSIKSPIDSGATFGPGSWLNVRVRMVGAGTTRLRIRVWGDNRTEPGSWQAAATNANSALQDPGAIGLQAYTPSDGLATTLRFDDLQVATP